MHNLSRGAKEWRDVWAMYEDLPVWEVDDYLEVTPASLRANEKEVTEGLADGRYNFDKLNIEWWRQDVLNTVEALSKELSS